MGGSERRNTARKVTQGNTFTATPILSAMIRSSTITHRKIACVASVPVRDERNIRPREGDSPSRGPILRSARTGTLATQTNCKIIVLCLKNFPSNKHITNHAGFWIFWSGNLTRRKRTKAKKEQPGDMAFIYPRSSLVLLRSLFFLGVTHPDWEYSFPEVVALVYVWNNREFKKLLRRPRRQRRLKNQFIFYLSISGNSWVINFVYHYQSYRELNLEHRNKCEIEFKKNIRRSSRSWDNAELVISRCCFAEDPRVPQPMRNCHESHASKRSF